MSDNQVSPVTTDTDTGMIDPETIKTGKDFRPWLLGLIITACGLFFCFVGKLKLPVHSWALWQQYTLLAFWVFTVLYYVVFAVFTHRLRNFNAQFKAAEGEAMRARLRGRMYGTFLMSAITIGTSIRMHTLIVLSWPATLVVLTEILNGTWILLFIIVRIALLRTRKHKQTSSLIR